MYRTFEGLVGLKTTVEQSVGITTNLEKRDDPLGLGRLPKIRTVVHGEGFTEGFVYWGEDDVKHERSKIHDETQPSIQVFTSNAPAHVILV